MTFALVAAMGVLRFVVGAVVGMQPTANAPEIQMTKDQIKGRIRIAKGKLQEVAGRAMGDESMEEDGKLLGAK